MSLFRSKPKKVYVFISYRFEPPTSSQQEEILSSLARGGTPVVLGEVRQLPEEQWQAPKELRDAYLKAEDWLYLATNNIGYSSKPKYVIREVGGLLVTTVSGDLL